MKGDWDKVVFDGCDIEKIGELTPLPLIPKTKKLLKKGYKLKVLTLQNGCGEAWYQLG